MPTLELTTLLAPHLQALNVWNYGTTFIAVALAVGVGMGFYKSSQDTVGIFTLIMFLLQLVDLNQLYWLTGLGAFVYALMVLAQQGEHKE